MREGGGGRKEGEGGKEGEGRKEEGGRIEMVQDNIRSYTEVKSKPLSLTSFLPLC